MLFPTSNIVLQPLKDDFFIEKQVSVSVLRLDGIHPVVSGNKLFKLHYFLQAALEQHCEGMVTFGGAYSNHLVATAYACKEIGLPCTGIVRGGRPAILSHTLKACLEFGMRLQFVSRQDYDKKNEPGFLDEIDLGLHRYAVIPEGGYHPLGAKGASLIMELVAPGTSHICVAVGTATTVAGLLSAINEQQQVLAFPVLRNLHDLEARVQFLTKHTTAPQSLRIMAGYHFGGYAKKTPALVEWMNEFYRKHGIPTDFVYTAKLLFGVHDAILQDVFPKGSKIVCIHTGGLQGNLSLKPGTLVF